MEHELITDQMIGLVCCPNLKVPKVNKLTCEPISFNACIQRLNWVLPAKNATMPQVTDFLYNSCYETAPSIPGLPRQPPV